MKRHVKTSLAPGSRVVTDYLTKAGLLPYLDKLGFYASPRTAARPASATPATSRPRFNEAITGNDLVCAAVLSGNRNFEARIHPNLKANFLASPPLVVALRDRRHRAEGPRDRAARPGHATAARLSQGHLADVARDRRGDARSRKNPEIYRALYGDVANANPMWGTIAGATGPGLQLAARRPTSRSRRSSTASR